MKRTTLFCTILFTMFVSACVNQPKGPKNPHSASSYELVQVVPEYGDKVTTDDAVRKLKSMGLALASVDDVKAYLMTVPEQNHPIVALGSEVLASQWGHIDVRYYEKGGWYTRQVRGGSTPEWPTDYRFLGVRK